VAPAALTDARVRELHARLIEAKRETQDAGAVSLEGLARSLKATEAKLREQHKNRKIDFDVVIKDGKAILKPTVR
jgi:glutamate mutase epsilon subunit